MSKKKIKFINEAWVTFDINNKITCVGRTLILKRVEEKGNSTDVIEGIAFVGPDGLHGNIEFNNPAITNLKRLTSKSLTEGEGKYQITKAFLKRVNKNDLYQEDIVKYNTQTTSEESNEDNHNYFPNFRGGEA